MFPVQISDCSDSQMRARRSLRELKFLFSAVVILTVVVIIYTLTLGGLGTPGDYHSVPPPGLQHRWISANCEDGRRLGNMLFNYASLLGIAATNNMTPFLPDEGKVIVRKIFKAPMVVENYWKNKIKICYDHQEYGRRASAYDRATKNFKRPLGVMLHGYFQSWMYFSDIEQELRKHLTFLPHVKEVATKYLEEIVPNDLKSDNVVRVGIHVRRGDQALERNRNHGYTSATKEYFTKAMKFFRDKYPSVLFVVCSDDIPWSKDNINGSNVIFSVGNSPGVDLAILASLDHTIMSVGTYGWWAAWLTNGTTVYYNDWPRPFSRLEYDVNKFEYFPRHWIPINL